MWWDISEGRIEELERLPNDGIFLSIRNEGKRRQYVFVDDQLRERLFRNCYEDSCYDYRFSKFYHTIESNNLTWTQLQLAQQDNQSFAYVGTFEFRGIKFMRAICASFPLHRCILRKMFEYPKDAQIFDSLKSIAEKIFSQEDEYDGKFLFFDKEGKFLGSFPDVDTLLIDLWENGIIKQEDSDDIDRVLEQIAGEAFLFEKVELAASQGHAALSKSESNVSRVVPRNLYQPPGDHLEISVCPIVGYNTTYMIDTGCN
jgi:hypothetical protein